MPACKNHSDREAIAQCSRCGAYLCEECIAPGDGDVLCFDCSIAVAKEALDHQEKAEAPPLIQPNRSRKFSGPLRFVLALGAVVIAAELGILLFMGPHVQKPNSAAAPLVSPKKQATAQAAADAVLISQSLEMYRREHGGYPSSLSAIAGALPPGLRATLNDPSTTYTRDPAGGYMLQFKGNGAVGFTIDPAHPGPHLSEVPQ